MAAVTTLQLPARSKSCSSPDLRARMTDALDSLPASPDGVITYMGRSYDVKDLFPALDPETEEETSNSEVSAPLQFKRDMSGKKSTVSRVDRRRHPTRRTMSNVEGRASLSPVPRTLNRSMSSSEVPPPSTAAMRRMAPPGGRQVTPGRSRSGSALTSMMQALQGNADPAAAACAVPPPPMNLTRARSLGDAATSVVNMFSGLQVEEEDYGIHSHSMRHLQYNQADVNGIIDDQQEFERLKATLKKKGAITNEVLKQRLHFYLKAKKDRDAGLLPPAPKRRSRGDRMRRSRSDAHKEDSSQEHAPHLMRRGTTGDIHYKMNISE